MKGVSVLWEALGDLDELESAQVLSRLFVIYEEELRQDPESERGASFFNRLDRVIAETTQCNLNRR